MMRPACLLLAALVVAACGKEGPPVAPERRLPRPVADLAGEVRDGRIHLTWTNPSRRADDTRLRELAAVHVYRAEDSPEGDPRPALLRRGRIAGYTEVLALSGSPAGGQAGAPALEPGSRVEVLDRENLTPGRRYTYVVLVEDLEGRLSPPSARVSVTLIAPPAPPVALQAEAGEQQVRLTWRPPGGLVTGEPLQGEVLYEVLRAPAPEQAGQPVTPAPIAETTFTDRGLENDRTYYYSVRALRREAGTLARGEPTPAVAATPADQTPPAPPRDLIAIPAGRSVRLSWGPSPDADVAAYVVYRAVPGGPFTRVGTARPPANVFADDGVPPGTYRYVVTALDAGARPNESRPSNEVEVTLP